MSSRSHRQPGFALYAVGICIWMALVSCCGTTYMLPLVPNQADAGVYVIVQQLSYVATYFVVAILATRRPNQDGEHRLFTATVGAFALLALSLPTVAFGPHPLWLLAAYGMLMGVAVTLGYMQWISLVSLRPMREIETLLFVASLSSIVSGALFCVVPLGWRLALFGIVLIPASLALLYANRRAAAVTRQGEGPKAENPPEASSALKAQNMPTLAGAHADPANTRQNGHGALFKALAVPSLLLMALVIIAPVVSTLYIDTHGQDTFRILLAQAANLVALGVLWFIYFVLKKRITVVGAYRTLLPVLATCVLIGAFFDPSQRWFVLFVADACFCVASILLLLTSCTIARDTGVSVTLIYGLMGGLVYLARTPEVLLVVYPAAPLQSISPFVTAILLYLLAVPGFLLPVLSRMGNPETISPTISGGNGAATTAKSHIDEVTRVCTEIATEYRLPARHVQVFEMLAKGQGVPRIAQELGLSENTVRTYRKSIYNTLDLHSHQELVDLVHARIGSNERGRESKHP